MSASSQPKYCCALFKSAVLSQGERGLSIVLGKSTRLGITGAFLEFRAIAEGDRLEVTIPNGPILTLGMQTGFLYCPWCGVSIRQFYDLVELPELDDRGHFMKLGG